MYFKRTAYLMLSVCISFLVACSDESRETNLVDLHTLAEQNITRVSFPAGNETVFSANSNASFSLIGLQSNGVDQVTVTGVEWSLSAGAVSTIDQTTGLLSAGAVAESITVNAKFGPLTGTLDIRISTAQFDKVTALHQQAFTIDMCRTQNLIPMGQYIGQNGAPDEVRPVDSTIINTITWTIVDQGETVTSKRAHIETVNDQAILRTLSAGDVVVQATATSVANGGVISADFDQTIGVGLTAIKLCNSTDTNLENCVVTAANLEENNVLSLVSVGTYQATSGLNEFIDITKNSQWGVNNIINNNVSIVYADNRQRIDVTGLIPNTSPVVTVACGEIEQLIADADGISQGVILNESVTCPNNANCLVSSVDLTISPLDITSLSVSANETDLITRQALTLTARPAEITLEVIATFSNNTNGDVTNSATLNYVIRRGAGIISGDNNVAGVYTVSGAGTAEIEVTVDGSTQQFNAIIVIP